MWVEWTQQEPHVMIFDVFKSPGSLCKYRGGLRHIPKTLSEDKKIKHRYKPTETGHAEIKERRHQCFIS